MQQSEEVVTYSDELRRAFQARAAVRRGRTVVEVEPFGANPNDGTFLMNFYDFRIFYTNIFAVVDFSDRWHRATVTGTWDVCVAVCHFVWAVPPRPVGLSVLSARTRVLLCAV